jgi:hypothetical protein
MDEKVIFIKTAFKHHVTKEDICQALEYPRYEDLMEQYVNKYLTIGYDRKANLLEIMYNIIDGGPGSEDTILVFHAMPCRPEWRELAN